MTKNTKIKLLGIQTDRCCYQTGNNILFKAYISGDFNIISPQVIDTLHTVLMDQDGLEVASGKFPVSNNHVEGNFEIPDFLTDGNYVLIASLYLGKNSSPENLFSRIIEIRKSDEVEFRSDLSLADTLYMPGGLLTAQIRFSAKENKPVPVSFTYQITGNSGEILSGKSKAGNDGLATLTLNLPGYDNKEVLKLLVNSSYKGTKLTAGIVIPTKYNYNSKKINSALNLQAGEFNSLKIQLNTDKLQYSQNEKVSLDIHVTDDKGNPVLAELTVSASENFPVQFSSATINTKLKKNQSAIDSDWSSVVYAMVGTTPETENIVLADDSGLQHFFSRQTRLFFAGCLLKFNQTPGRQFIVQEKNNVKKLQRNALAAMSQNGYSTDRKVLDILMQIKSYHIENDQIFFGGNAMNSISQSQAGALIIIDGIKMGTDASILTTIPVTDIARITASTSPMDIQKYSGLNSTGIIEIYTKKNPAYSKAGATTDKIKSTALFWEPDIISDNTGKASVHFNNGNNPSEITVSVSGVSTNGLSGYSSVQYSVK